MEYQFSQHISKEDYVAFLMNHLKMNILKPLNLVFLIGGLGYLLLAPLFTGSEDLTFTFVGLALGAVMVLSVVYFRYNAKKRYDKNKDLFDMTYKVTDDLFSFAVGQEWIDKKWIDFYSAAETADYLYVFVSKDSGSVLIKRDIPNDALQFIKDKLRAHVNPKRVKLLSDEKTTA